MKNSFVYCIPNKENDREVLDFYMIHKNNTLYLFRQKYNKSTHSHYQNKCILKDAVDYKRAHSDEAIKNVIKRLRLFIPYIEKEYDISLRKKAA